MIGPGIPVILVASHSMGLARFLQNGIAESGGRTVGAIDDLETAAMICSDPVCDLLLLDTEKLDEPTVLKFQQSREINDRLMLMILAGGSEQERETAAALQMPGDEIVAKPFSFAKLSVQVANALERLGLARPAN
jgi:DNA-binding response OmpR family regulator